MKTWLKILSISVATVLILLLVVVLILTSSPGENYVRGWLENRLEAAVGLPVSIGKFETNLWSRVRIDTLVVHTATEGETQPLLYVGQVRLRYSIPQLLGQTITVKGLFVDSLTLAVELDSLGRLGVPMIDASAAAAEDSGQSTGMMRIDTISVERVGLGYRDPQLPLSVELAGAMLSARGTGDGAISGHVVIADILAVYDSLAVKVTNVEAAASLSEKMLRIDYAQADCEGLHVKATGDVGLADPGNLALTVSVDGMLDTLASALASYFDVPSLTAGTMNARCRIEGALDNPNISVEAELDDLLVREVAVASALLRARYHDNHLLVDTFHVATLGGAINGNAATTLDTLGSTSLHLILDDIDLSSLWAAVYAETSPYEGTLNGDVNAAGRSNDVPSWAGAANVTGRNLRYLDRQVPDLTCQAEFDSGRTKLSLIHGSDEIHADVTFGEDSVFGSFTVAAPDIRALARFIDQPDLSGALHAEGKIAGAYLNPTLHATVFGSGIAYRNFPVDTMFADVSYEDSSLAIIDFRCEGRLDSIDSRQPPFALDSVAGSLAYACRVQGPLDNLSGECHAYAGKPRYGSYDIDSLSIAATLSGSRLTIAELEAYRGDLAARLSAVYDTATATGSFDLLLRPSAMPSGGQNAPTGDTIEFRDNFGSVSGHFALGAHSDLSASVQGQGLWLGLLSMFTGDTILTDGEIGFDLAVDGPYLTPAGVLTTTARSIRVAEYQIDSVSTHLHVAQDALILDSLTTFALGHTLRASGRLALSISPDGSYELTDSASVTAELSTTDFDLSVLQGFLLPDGEVSGTVSALLGVSGRLASPRLNGWLRAGNARVLLEAGSSPLENVGLSLLFADSVLTIESATATVSDMAIDATGSVTTSTYESAAVALEMNVGQLGGLTVDGNVSDTSVRMEIRSDSLNLAVFQPFMTELDSLQGTMGCRILIVGQPAAPQIDGSLQIGSLSLQSPRHHIALSDGHAGIRFDKNRIILDSALCLLNGGNLAVSGLIAHAQGELTDIELTLNANHITLQEPGTYIIVVDSAAFTYGKQQENYVFDGDIILGETRFTAGLRPTSILPWVQSIETVDLEFPELIARTRLDVRVRESDKLWVDNNLARIRLRAELGVIGTPLRPNFTGLVKIEEGYLLYLDRRFRVKEGSVYFSDPTRFNPDITLDASTSVTVYRRTVAETYTVYIGAEGLLDQLQYGLYSEPALENPDIVALLTLGATRSELVGSGETNGSGGLTGVLKDRAAMLTSQRVSNYVSRKAGSFFGFDEFTIQGNLFQFDETWGPQLVASKRLSRRVDLTYSTTVGHLNDQSMRLGYRLTPRFSLQGETDRQGRAGIDLKYGITFK